MQETDAGHSRPFEMESYLALDFSPVSAAAARLAGALPAELSAPIHFLSDHVGETPPDLTAAMAAWFQTDVAPARSAALSAIARVSGAQDQVKHGSSVFLEREIDAAEDQRIVEKRSATTANQEKNATAYRKLSEAEAEKKQSDREYQTLYNQHKRQPKIPNPFIYVAGLSVFGVVEVLLNLDYFRELDISPAIALGLTLVIALIMAMSAHFTGTAIRQAAVLLHKSRDDLDRWTFVRMVSLGQLALYVGLAIVASGRYTHFSELVREAILLGDDPPSALRLIGGSLLSNLGAWILGVLWAYGMHDADPAFPAAAHAKERNGNRLSKLELQLRAPLAREYEKIDSRADQRIERARRQHESLSAVPNHIRARQLYADLSAQDANVLALLRSYRANLVTSLREKGQTGVMFHRVPVLLASPDDQLAAAQYVALNLRLKHV